MYDHIDKNDVFQIFHKHGSKQFVLHQMSSTFVTGAIQEFQVARANLRVTLFVSFREGDEFFGILTKQNI